MSEFHHTPGPWVYSLRSDWAEISQPGGFTVASLQLRLLDINTSMADVRLIAAAPDLLAALAAALPHLDYEHVPNDVWFAAKKAVAAATGDAS